MFCDAVKCKVKGCRQFSDIIIDGRGLCGMHAYSCFKNKKPKYRIVKTTHGKISRGRLFWPSRYLAKKAGSTMRIHRPNGSYGKHPESGRLNDEVVYIREVKK